MRKLCIVLVCFLLVIAGCSQRPTRVAAPNIDPETAAHRAMEVYDTNEDGSLNKSELAACPGIVAHLSLYDQNGDGSVSGDEFAARLQEMYGQRVGLTQVTSHVMFQGRPLANAEVVFEPEPYLSDEIQVANGTTDSNGSAQMSIASEDLPESLRERHMRLSKVGTYKVRITHPSIPLPAKYNTNTTLGYESQLGNPSANFDLTAK